MTKNLKNNVAAIRNMNKLHPSFNLQKNVLKIHNAEIDSPHFLHELAKFLLLWEARSNNHIVYTEAIFNNMSRADLYLADIDEAWEVTLSEKDKSKKEKEQKYPCSVYFFSAAYVIKNWLKKLKL